MKEFFFILSHDDSTYVSETHSHHPIVVKWVNLLVISESYHLLIIMIVRNHHHLKSPKFCRFLSCESSSRHHLVIYSYFLLFVASFVSCHQQNSPPSSSVDTNYHKEVIGVFTGRGLTQLIWDDLIQSSDDQILEKYDISNDCSKSLVKIKDHLLNHGSQWAFNCEFSIVDTCKAWLISQYFQSWMHRPNQFRVSWRSQPQTWVITISVWGSSQEVMMRLMFFMVNTVWSTHTSRDQREMEIIRKSHATSSETPQTFKYSSRMDYAFQQPVHQVISWP